MTVYYRPKLGDFWLPLPILSWEEEPLVDIDMRKIPLVAGRTLASIREDIVNITISGIIPGAPYAASVYNYGGTWTIENARTVRATMLALLGTYGLKLYRFSNRYWDSCVVSQIIFRESNRPLLYIPYTLTVQALNPTEQTDTALSDESPWYGGVDPTIVSGLEDVVPMLTSERSPYSFVFPGIAAAHASGEDAKIVPFGPASSTLTVKQIVIQATTVPGATGDTVIKAALSSINGDAGSVCSITLPEGDSTVSAYFASGISVSTSATGVGSPVYVYIESGGAHTDISGYITLQYGT